MEQGAAVRGGGKIVRSKHRSSVNAHHVTTTSRLRSDPQAPQGPLSPLLLLLLNTTRTDPTVAFSPDPKHTGAAFAWTEVWTIRPAIHRPLIHCVNRQKAGERRSLPARSYADRHFA